MMPTTREFLGDSLIKELEGAGFSPQSINAFAKNEYRQRKAAQEEEQRRLLYRADDMKLDGKVREALLSGDINEQEAKNAQKFEEFGSKKHGFALGAAKTVTGIANTAERVGDFINPFYEGKRDKDGNYIYQNGLEKSLRSKIKNVEKMRDDYEKATGETSWGSRLSEIGTELVGDPINFVGGVGLLSKGSKLAQFGKKTLYFAGTGAASGGVAALGEGKNDEETLKNIGAGAAGGALLGHVIDQGIQGISKLIAKRQANKVANEADAIESAENSEFLDGNNNTSVDSVAAQLKTAETMTAREFATEEVGLDETTATKVVKEVMQGKEKSDWTDSDTYADIAKFKNFEIQREYAKAYGEKIQAAQVSINNAREQSAIRYADTQKAINEYQKQGMSASATRELINAKFKPSADEIDYTRAYNDGADVDARLAGQGIFYALEKDIAAQAYTPEIYATRLKQMGFSDESVQAFTQAYASKDIDIAKEYVNKKVADAYESRVQREVADEINSENRININKDGAYSGHPMLRPNEPSIGQGDLKGNLINEEAKNSTLPNGVSGIGDNASRARGRQGGDEEILRQSGRNTSSASQTKQTAQSDKQMEQRSAFKTDGDTDATAASKQMVEKQGRDDEKVGDSFSHFTIDDAINKKLNFINRNNLGKKGWLDDLNLVIKKYGLKDKETKNKFMSVMISDKFKFGREFHHSELKDVMPRISPLSPKYPEISNNAYKELNEIIKNKTIPATKEQNLRFFEEDANGASEDALHSHTDTKPAVATGAKEINAKTINANSHIASGLVGGTLNSIDEDGSFNPEKFAAGFIAGLAGSKAVAIAARKMTPQLYNKILGVAKKMPQMAKDNPKLLGKLYANGKDVSLNSFAGEKAITANVGKLDQAKAMLEKGADEVEIWQKTGWFKDEIDDKWKFEINPRGGELKPNPPRNTVLYNVLNDEKLYEAYPELQLYKVEIAGKYNPAALKALGSSNGGFIPSQKMIIINEKATDFKSTLYHEIQHAIQEIEGFSAGASGKDGKYWLAGGEVEARNVQKRMSGVSYDGFKSSTSMEFFPYKEEAQLQRMAGDKEFMEYHELSKKFDDYLNDKGDGLSAQEETRLDELYGKIKDRLGFTEDDYKKGYEFYLKEITEYHKHPLHTLDAQRGERVNIDRGDLNLSRELEKKYILKDGSINEAAVRKEAEPFIEKEYSLENFKAEFPNGKVDTPIGEVDISVSQFYKLGHKGRDEYFGLIKPTLERPAFVVDFEDTTFFFKPFRDKDGVIKFASVIKERDGGLDVVSNYPMKNRKFELITREGKVRYVQGSVVVRPLEHSLDNNIQGSVAKSPIEHSLDDTVRSSGGLKPIEHSSDGKDIIPQNEEKIYHSRKIEEIKREHPNVEKELDESIVAMRKDSFNDSNFKALLMGKFDTKEITTQQLGKNVDLSDKQLAVLKNDIKNADFKAISDSKIYFDKVGKAGDKKRFFIDIAEDGNIRVDAYAKSQIDSIPIKENALQELAGVGDRARLKNMSFEVKAAYRNELDPIKKEAILKTAELNKLKKAAQSGDKVAVAKFEEFKAKNLDKYGNIKDGLRLC